MPNEADIPAIIALLNAHDQAEMDEPSFSYEPSDILNDWRDLNLVSDAWVVHTNDGFIVSYGTLTQKIHVGRIFADGYVHPDHSGRGLGSLLIDLMEYRAQELLPLFPEDARVLIVNNIVATNTSACHLLEKYGYLLRRVFFTMAIQLSVSMVPVSWPQRFVVRVCDGSEEDLYRVYKTIEEGFQDHWGHVSRSFEEWKKNVLAKDFDPSLSFLVQEGEEIVAAALCRMTTAEEGWVSNLAVKRSWRKQGLGTLLLHHIFATFYQRGAERVGLAVDSESLTGAQRLYERVGMKVTLRIGRYEKELRAGRELFREDG